jgi:hypothetical protein
MSIDLKGLLKLVFSFPAIAFWIAIFGASSFLLSALGVHLITKRPRDLLFPPLPILISNRYSGPLVRIGITASAIGIALAAFATHRFGTIAIRTAKRAVSFSSRTLWTASVSAAISVVSLLAVGWTQQHFLSCCVYFVSGIANHVSIDFLAPRKQPLAWVVHLGTGALAAVGLVLGAIAGKLGWRGIGQFASLCEIAGFVVLHLRFLIDGEIVLGAKFLPAEAISEVFGNADII